MTTGSDARGGSPDHPPRDGYRWLTVLAGLLLVALWGFTVIMYGQLPEMIPGHIGPDGVTRWVPRSSGVWFLIPAVGTFSALMPYVMSVVVAKSPPGPGINVPHKKRLLALPREGQLYAMQPVRAFARGMAAWVLLLMLVIQVQFFRIAIAAQTTDPETGNLLHIVVGLTALAIPGVIWLSAAVRSRIEAYERSGSP